MSDFTRARQLRGTNRRFRVEAPAEAILIVNAVNVEDAEQQARKLLASYETMRFNTSQPLSFRLVGADAPLVTSEVRVGPSDG